MACCIWHTYKTINIATHNRRYTCTANKYSYISRSSRTCLWTSVGPNSHLSFHIEPSASSSYMITSMSSVQTYEKQRLQLTLTSMNYISTYLYTCCDVWLTFVHFLTQQEDLLASPHAARVLAQPTNDQVTSRLCDNMRHFNTLAYTTSFQLHVSSLTTITP